MATATTPTNRITRSVQNGQSVFPDASALISSSSNFNQGDLLFLDTSAHLLKTASAESDNATFVGIATQTVVSGKLKRPFTTAVDASFGADVVEGPAYNVVAKLPLMVGDSLNPGDLVYGNPVVSPADVASTGTKAIGVYQGPAISGAAAGTKVEVLLGTRFPADALKF